MGERGAESTARTDWPRMEEGRVAALDILRGTAVVLMVVGHVLWLVDQQSVGPMLYLALVRATDIASILFVLVAGAMLSYFLSTRKRRPVVRRFARRALLLLLVVHPILTVVRFPEFEVVNVFRQWHVTDAIAVFLVLAPPVMARFQGGRLACLAGLLVAVSALARAFWVPGDEVSAVLKVVLFGRVAGDHANVYITYPLVPWFAVFLAGSLLGAAVAAARGSVDAGSRVVARMRTLAGRLALAGVLLVGFVKLSGLADAGPWHEVMRPDRATTLLPVYLAGALIGCVALLVYGQREAGFGRIAWAVSVFGRTSLFAFVAQYLLVWALPVRFGYQGRLGFGALFPACLAAFAVLWPLCFVYGRSRGRLALFDYGKRIIRMTSSANLSPSP